MNKLILLFGVLLCLVLVNARHYSDRQEGETVENEEETLKRPHGHSQAHRRRRRWQMNYGYDYPPPPPSFQYQDRRDYERNNQETQQQTLMQIYKLLEEIKEYVRRPPPPPPPPQPMPIYIPYPVIQYPQVQSLPCTPSTTNSKVPDANVTVEERFKEKDMDPNRNWGLVVSSENDYDDGSDGSRPISFDPIVPKQIMQRPAPKVEHGSIQGSHSTAAPLFLEPSSVKSERSPVPGMCNAAILSCCGLSNDTTQQKQCFKNIGCEIAYDDGNACSATSIQNALESFRLAYSPLT